MKKHVMASLTIGAGLLLFAGGVAFANQTVNTPTQNPTTGHKAGPTNTCGPGLPTPGNAVNAGGSPFNANGTAGGVYAGNPDTSSLHANSTAPVSQYDNACLNIP
jgi:hypothetical protein